MESTVIDCTRTPLAVSYTHLYVILGVNAILADTDKEAKRLSTTMIQSFLNIVTSNQKGLMQMCIRDRAPCSGQ